MAIAKKNTTEVKTEAPKAVVKPAAKAAVKATVKPVAKPAAKTVTKTATAKAAAKPAVKTATKAAVKPAAAKKAPAKKVALKSTLTVQFDGKSYSEEDLVKIAKDIWRYDLKKKVGDFKSVDLYVKPEESKAYYVINGQFTGDFTI